MDLQIEYRPGNVRVILQGPRDSQEMCRILALLQSNGDKLWAADGQGGITAILPQDIVWAETVDDNVRLHGNGYLPGGLQPGILGAALGAAGVVSLRQIRAGKPAGSAKPA